MINNRVIRELLKVFKVHFLLDWLLGVLPRTGKFGSYSYPVNSLEALIVEREIFKAGIYDNVFDLSGVKTFVDLGCNRGFFSLWLAEKSGLMPQGILVEANPALIPQVQRLLDHNGFNGMTILNGAAGAGIQGGEVEILVPPTDVGAGLRKTTEKSLAGDKCDLVRVPAIRVADVWDQRFSQGERCGILKIDIEGAEKTFLEDECDFLKKVDRIVVEVHESMVSMEAIKTLLVKNGFLIIKEAKEDSETALIFAKMKPV